jgi:PAS domain-containing protein
MFCLEEARLSDVDCAARGAPLHFISDIYDCAVDPGRWATVLRSTAELIKGCAAAIIVQTPGEDAARIEARWNVNAKFERAMIATAPFAPTVPAIWLLGVDNAFTTSALFGDEKLHTSIWHKKAMQPHALNDVAVVPLTRSARTFSALLVMRDADAGPYSPEDTAALSKLSPHLRHAAAAAGLPDVMPLDRHGKASIFNSMTAGIILTNTAGKILHTNAAAAKLLDGCALLCLEDELAARDAATDDLLREAIANAADVRNTKASETVAPIIVKGPAAKRLAVWVRRIDERMRPPGTTPYSARVAVFVRALDAIAYSPAEMFLRQYSITVAESRLLALLSQGLTLDHAARALPLPLSAAGAHLADVVRKTATRDQADLIARLTAKRALVPA